MTWNWQVIISFVLFVMLVVAFTFAIWSYVKTNAIKNSESPSVQTVINDNNTYVNNIASAPNVVTMGGANLPTSYTLKTTDNGSEIFLYPGFLGTPLELTIEVPNGLPDGFYVKAINVNDNPVIVTFLGAYTVKIQLAQYEWAYYAINVSSIGGSSGTFVPTNGTVLPST
jgi:hypothetical protein